MKTGSGNGSRNGPKKGSKWPKYAKICQKIGVRKWIPILVVITLYDRLSGIREGPKKGSKRGQKRPKMAKNGSRDRFRIRLNSIKFLNVLYKDNSLSEIKV